MSALLRTISYSDDELISLIQNKNSTAFEYLYDKYAAALYGSICRYVDDKNIAEEVLQQTFLSIWQSLSESSAGFKNHLLIKMMSVARNIVNEKKPGNNLATGYQLAAV